MPRNQLEFEVWFAGENGCKEYLVQLRWPEGFRYPKCGQGKGWPVWDGVSQCANCAPRQFQPLTFLRYGCECLLRSGK